MDRVIKKHKNANPWLDRDTLNNYKRFKETAHDTAKEDEAAESYTDKENSHSINVASKKRGRPKGTTKKEILAAKRKKQMALIHAALEALELKKNCK